MASKHSNDNGSELSGSASTPSSGGDFLDSAAQVTLVGVGYSMSERSAVENLLKQLPRDCGIAVVLIQACEDDDTPFVAAQLQTTTKLSVHLLHANTLPQPNSVYLIAPSTVVTLEYGALRIHRNTAGFPETNPIDYLFQSMARNLGTQAIGVLLGGEGSDGIQGIRSIRGQGGKVLVQDPEACRSPTRLLHAIGTRLVDFVLPLAQLPAQIIKLAQLNQRPSSALNQEIGAFLQSIIDLIKGRLRHDLQHYPRNTLYRQVQQHMARCQTNSLTHYLQTLRDSDQQLESLVLDLLISETEFFRDPDAWDQLMRELMRELMQKQRKHQEFRLWVTGCASGEDAYSLAMLLLETLEIVKFEGKVQLFASDIDEVALERARLGIYPERIKHQVSAQRLERFFHAENDQYRIDKSLREITVFANQDLLSDPPFTKIDVLVCRNLLSYLASDQRDQVLGLLHYAMRDQGLLFCGPSEPIDHLPEQFQAVNKDSRIYRRVGESKRLLSPFPLVRDNSRLKRNPASANLSRSDLSSINLQLRNTLFENYVPATVLVTEQGESLHFYGPVARFLELGSGEPTQNIFALAPQHLSAKLRCVLQRCVRDKKAHSVATHVQQADAKTAILVGARPLQNDHAFPQVSLYVISFEVLPDEPSSQTSAAAAHTPEREIQAIEHELDATRDELNSVIEELKTSNEELRSSNEEVMSMNEELQASNEELEASKEELQSLNEELNTVNTQLQERVHQLEDSTDDMNNLLISTQVAALFLGKDLCLRRFTPSSTQLFHLIPSDVGRPLDDIKARHQQQHLLAKAMTVMQTLEQFEEVIEDKSGHFFLCRIRPYLTNSDRIDGVVITYTEITELKQLEVELKSSEQRLQNIIDGTNAATWEWNIETGETLFNERWAKGIGYRLQELEPISIDTWMRLCHPDDLERSNAAIQRHLAGETRFYECEVRMQHKQGHWVWFMDRGRVSRFNDAGEPAMMHGTHIDISERKLFEQRLSMSEARLHALIEATPDAIFLKDGQGRYRVLNSAAARFFGKTKDQIIGRSDHELMPKAQADAIVRVDQELMHSAKIVAVEEWLETPDHRRVQFEAIKGPILNDEGQVVSVFGIARDVTEIRQKQREANEILARKTAEAEAANAAKSRFLSNMSHEIRTPLNAILGMTHVVRQRDIADSVDDMLGKIEYAGAHLRDIVNDVLDSSKIEAGELELHPINFSIHALVKRVMSIVENPARAKGLHFVNHVDDSLDWLVGDKPRLRQAVLNYLGNAIKFSATGDIRLSIDALERDGSRVLIRFAVQDNGPGLSDAEKSQLFQSFKQLDNTITRANQGTGLGLSITKHLAELMGGEVGIDSTPGAGSTFWFTAWLEEGLEEKAHAPEQSEQEIIAQLKVIGTHKTILLAEDDLINQEVAINLLSDAGLQTCAVDNGQQAIDYFAREESSDCALILMDVHMPVMDGLKATRALRKLTRTKDIPILAMTAAAFDDDIKRCLEAGMDGVVSKPVDPLQLYSTLLKWLKA